MEEEQLRVYNLLCDRCNDGRFGDVLDAFLNYYSTDLLNEEFTEFLVDEGIIDE